MHHYIRLVVVIIVFALYLLWFKRKAKGVEQINPTTLEKLLRSETGSVEVIDVREPYEFSRGHIPRAKNIPLAKLSGQLKDLQPNQKVVFVCRSGSRSMMASKQAHRAGLTAIYNLTGGMSGWKGPVQK